MFLYIGTALLTHGSHIKLGCLQFTFSIVEPHAPVSNTAFKTNIADVKQESVSAAGVGDSRVTTVETDVAHVAMIT